jgi:uncharacterized repeat protein (TIGR01451 family)
VVDAMLARRRAGSRTRSIGAIAGGLVTRRGLALAVVLGMAGATLAGSAPSSAAGSASPVEDLISACPSSGEIASLNADLAISFEADPTAGTLVCHAADGSADLTRFQERVYQALRVMKAMQFSSALPWTSQSLYDWFVATLHGIRFRNDITFSFCCDPANVIDIIAAPNSAALFTNRWMDPTAPLGLHDLVALLVHEARHNNGLPHTCGSNDQTIGELGAWGTEYYLELWEALYSGAFLTAPDPYPSYYRDQHLLTAESVYLPRICTRPNADLSLAITAPTVAVRGSTVSYTFTATNLGPDPAGAVFVSSPVPAGTRFVGASAGQGSCSAASGGPIACAFGPIAAGGSAQATVVLRVDASGTVPVLTNKEAAAALGAWVTGPVNDANHLNNAATFSTPVVEPDPQTLVADLVATVRGLGLPSGIEQSLVTKLRGARDKLVAARTDAACSQLRAFANEVRDLQADHRLTIAQAGLLLDGVRLIRSLVPCT